MRFPFFSSDYFVDFYSIRTQIICSSHILQFNAKYNTYFFRVCLRNWRYAQVSFD